MTKSRNNGSRNSTPGNIWVASTASRNDSRPRKRQRLTAYAAMIATATDSTVAAAATTTELAKYRASGTVDHISTNGRRVGSVGIQRKALCTWLRGLTAVLTMTTSGALTKTVNTTRVVRRKIR